MPTKELTYRIGMDIGELRRNGPAAGQSVAAFRKELAALEKQQRDHRAAMNELGRSMVGFGAAVVAGLGLAAKAAIDWETAFTGVRKTVDGSDQEIAALEGQLRKLATTLPATHEEIAGVAEAAGQLGIKREDIAAFTKTMVDLGETTNLTAEEAATDLAKFSNIMGTSAKDVDKLGSALVALGNDGASTEKDIISMGLRIAAAGKQIGLTESQVLGFASSLSSVGIEAEAGGSSFSTAMIKISSAVQKGGAELEAFAKVAGQTSEHFAARFRSDAAGAIIDFLKGLGRMQKAGEDVFGVLGDLELTEIRVRDALLRAGASADMFTKSLQVGSTAWAENTALTEEANKRYETSASKLRVAANQIKDALIDVGATIVPIVSSVTGGVADIVRGFQSLPGPIQAVVTWVGVAAAGIGLVGGAALMAVPKVLRFRESMAAMAATGGAGSRALAGFGRFLVGPWGVALAAGTLLLGAFAAKSGAAAAAQDHLRQQAKEIADVISEQNGVMTTSVRQIAAKKAAEEGLLQVTSKLGLEGGKVTEAILDQGKAYEDTMRVLMDRANALRESDPSSFIEGEGKVIVDTMGKLRALHDETKAGIQTNKDAKDAAEGTADAQKELASATGESAEALKEQKTAFDNMMKSFSDSADALLAARDAQRNLIELGEQSAAMLKKNGKGLDENTKKGRENAEQLDAHAAGFLKMAEAAAFNAEQIGGTTAANAALQASLAAARPQLQKIAEGFGMSTEEAKKFVDRMLPMAGIVNPGLQQVQAELARVRDEVNKIPPGKKITIDAPSAPAIAELERLGFKVQNLPNGRVEVTAATAGAQHDLDELVRRNQNRIIGFRAVLSTAAVGAGGKYFAFAGGGIHGARQFASGGIEPHRPQIAARSDGMRVWNEPEAGGETYLSWDPAKRSASLHYMQRTANAWGYTVVPTGALNNMAAMAATGGAAGVGGGITVENVNVRAYSDHFKLRQIEADLAMAGVR